MFKFLIFIKATIFHIFIINLVISLSRKVHIFTKSWLCKLIFTQIKLEYSYMYQNNIFSVFLHVVEIYDVSSSPEITDWALSKTNKPINNLSIIKKRYIRITDTTSDNNL